MATASNTRLRLASLAELDDLGPLVQSCEHLLSPSKQQCLCLQSIEALRLHQVGEHDARGPALAGLAMHVDNPPRRDPLAHPSDGALQVIHRRRCKIDHWNPQLLNAKLRIRFHRAMPLTDHVDHGRDALPLHKHSRKVSIGQGPKQHAISDGIVPLRGAPRAAMLPAIPPQGGPEQRPGSQRDSERRRSGDGAIDESVPNPP
mmetsp:Transcript_45779/g.146962  ORF Transcript_45779/g.146962 Transcript_45779/m.146962 type:complete len:203 (-) Transcript_45779:296-904(-)